MKKKVKLEKITLVGLSVRTNNKNELNPKTSKIGELASHYWQNKIFNKIKHRITPGITYAVYTDYENGEYTYFMGEAVTSIQTQDLTQFTMVTIPESSYQKFTTKSGKIPDIIISVWQSIWAMKESELEGKRQYIADFEIYDQRAIDINNAVVDIYIGIKN